MALDLTVTYVARLTPAGRGAVATLALWGPQAAALVTARFRPHGAWQTLDHAAPAPAVGTWPVGDAREEIVLRQTGPQAFEVHCHGGAASVSAIVAGLRAEGAQSTAWETWLASATPDVVSRMAWQMLASASAERPAAILLDQLTGAWRRELDTLAGLLPHDTAAIRQRLTALRGRAALGSRLTKPFRVVLCGEPNVGKSSLINALLGYRRAIAAPEPGTTRDVVAAVAACGGWLVELADTAGLRDTSDQLEAAGIARTRGEIAAAELVLWVVDASQAAVDSEGQPVELRDATAGVLAVANKCDLPLQRELPADALRVSAVTGEGIEGLAATIAQRLVPNPPPPGAAVPITPEQAAFLDAALEASDADLASLLSAQLEA